MAARTILNTVANYSATGFVGTAWMRPRVVILAKIRAIKMGSGFSGSMLSVSFIAGGIAILLTWIAQNTRFGRYTYAVGANREAVRRAGVNLEVHTLMLYGMSGLLAGLAGMINAAHFSTASSTSEADDLLVAIAAGVIGGTPLNGGEGRIWGTVVGALIYTLLENGFVLMDVPAFWQLPVIGLLIVVSVSLDQYQRRLRTELSAYRSLDSISADDSASGSSPAEHGADDAARAALLKRNG